jgi:hypothetical protein
MGVDVLEFVRVREGLETAVGIVPPAKMNFGVRR